MSVGNGDENALALSSARAYLARGELAAAAAILLRAAGSATGTQAMLVAEFLIAARLPDDATRLAIRIAQEQADAWPWINRFAGHMRARGDLEASRRVIGAFIATHPAPSVERMHADMALALGLPAGYRDSAELHASRQAYLRQLREFVASYPPDVLLDIGTRANDLATSHFYLAYQGYDDLVAQSIYGDWLSRSLAALAPSPSLPSVCATNDRPTIAFISSRWHGCTVGWYFAAWVEHFCRSWNVALVHTPDARRDALTSRLATQCGSETMLAQTVDAAAAQVRALAPDIVLYPEVGLEGFTIALAAQRLAPVQVCAWGHPVTTGLPTMDAFITCGEMEPVGSAAHYRERLIGLPGIGTRYMTPSLPPATAPRDIGLPSDRSLYLMPQVLHKWHPDVDRHLVEIVRRDPSAGFVMFELQPPSPAGVINKRLLQALSEVSARPEMHLIWMPECSRTDYLRVNRACHVMVDTPHWSGGNATLDALSCGVPVVTLPGRFMRGCQSATMLRLLGCEELIAGSVEELADIAVAVAHDETRRTALAGRIRDRLPSLTQSNESLLSLEASLANLLAAPTMA